MSQCLPLCPAVLLFTTVPPVQEQQQVTPSTPFIASHNVGSAYLALGSIFRHMGWPGVPKELFAKPDPKSLLLSTLHCGARKEAALASAMACAHVCVADSVGIQ
jgi:hypothetical protein